MTNPLTPREKVEKAVRNAIGRRMRAEVDPVLSFDIKRRWAERDAAVTEATDAILTALASGSGSGDHAELARLAEVATLGKWQNGIDDCEGVVALAEHAGNVICLPPTDDMQASLEFWPRNAAFIAAANPATVLALLAENAALRAANTEAERKLAEAVGLNDRAAELMRQCTDPDRFEGASTLNVYANMRAWLSDLHNWTDPPTHWLPLPPAPGAEDE